MGVNSIQTTRDRLVADNAEFDVLEIKDGVSLYRNPVQTMDKMKSLIPVYVPDDVIVEDYAEFATEEVHDTLMKGYGTATAKSR